MSAEIIELHSTAFNTPITNSLESESSSEKELLDYLFWSMKHEQDPHNVYDDPIAAFRQEMKDKMNVAC